MRVAEVDADNRFVRWTSREDIHANRLPHRSIYVMVFDSRGRLVVQKRHRDKLTYAGYWDVSCSGHVEEPDHLGGPDENLDQVYQQVARRELAEELGLSDAALTRIGVFAPEPGVHYEHFHLFRTVHDGPYIMQPEELEAVEAITPTRFDEMVADAATPVTASLVWLVSWWRRERREFLA